MRHQNLRSGQHDPHPVRHASPSTMNSLSVWIACMIGVSRRKAVDDISILERIFNSSRMDLVILNFSLKFHNVLCTFDK